MIGVLIHVHVGHLVAGVGAQGALARLVGAQQGALPRLARGGAAQQGPGPCAHPPAQEAGVVVGGAREGGGGGPAAQHHAGAGQGPTQAGWGRAHAAPAAVKVGAHTSLNN